MTIRVLFIAGAGRSGTTFLSLMLSQHEDTQNVGQIRDLPQAVRQNAPCSCNQPVPTCAFWQVVRTEFTARHGKAALDELDEGMAGFQKAANKVDEWQDPRARAGLAKANADFLARFRDLYLITADAAGGTMLIDSSKSVHLALALSLIPEIDLYVLNLVRDPRAVSISWAKVLKNEQKLRGRTRNWVGRQQRLQLIKQANPEKFMVLRYEDLTSDPVRWVAEIQKWAGLATDASFFIDANTATISWDRAHLFPPANATVLKERKSEIAIKPADSWRDPKNAALHKMAEELTFPEAENFGYEKGVTP